MLHDKKTFIKEYCLARRIPYKFLSEQLYINGVFCCFSVYNLPWAELIYAIDTMVSYDEYGFFKSLNR